ncbi:hypothetical protein BpHYR1_018569 [Brachionus plicatilis]|uniref:Uncharacterized protein n=1 Tax=Brachionus plicatilis TaxID=10195 RepID=A0A3M7QVX8_BRAPC|nr:hypothetical protein BpHYR1_018569 [Brachionus plicatilis]
MFALFSLIPLIITSSTFCKKVSPSNNTDVYLDELWTISSINSKCPFEYFSYEKIKIIKYVYVVFLIVNP